jgi:hypothetical protein
MFCWLKNKVSESSQRQVDELDFTGSALGIGIASEINPGLDLTSNLYVGKSAAQRGS